MKTSIYKVNAQLVRAIVAELAQRESDNIKCWVPENGCICVQKDEYTDVLSTQVAREWLRLLKGLTSFAAPAAEAMAMNALQNAEKKYGYGGSETLSPKE